MTTESTDNTFIDIENKSNFKNENDSQFQTDYHNSNTVSEFSVKITNYKKVASFLETFLVYSIETSGDFRPFLVERRYNDFQWLYNRLMERYPMAIVPPLSTKHNVTSIERFSGTFIEQRLNALDKFLQRLTEHHIIGLDQEFWSFLTLLPTMFHQYKRDRPVLGKVETLFQSIQNLSIAAQGMVNGGTSGTIIDPIFTKLVDDSARMSTMMTSLGRVVRRTEEVWQSISTAIQDATVNTHEWQSLPATAALSTQTASVVRSQVEPWVAESALYFAQVERVARRRNDAEARFLASVAKQQQHQATAIQYQRSQSTDLGKQEANAMHDTVSKNNADLASELDRWRSQRRVETADWLKRLADLHVDHYKQACAVWRQMVTNVCEQPTVGD